MLAARARAEHRAPVEARRLSRFRPGLRALRAQRRPARGRARLAAAARGGRRRALGGRAQRRPGRPDACSTRSRPPATATRSPARRAPLAAGARRGRARARRRRTPRRRLARGARRRCGRHDHAAAGAAARPRRLGQGPHRRSRRRALARRAARWVVDAGGDVRGRRRRTSVLVVAHPLAAGAGRATARSRDGAVATSSIVRRAWRARRTARRPPPARPRDRRAGVDRPRSPPPRSRRPRSRPRRSPRPRCSAGPARRAAVLAPRGGIARSHAGGDVETVGPLPAVRA